MIQNFSQQEFFHIASDSLVIYQRIYVLAKAIKYVYNVVL